MPLIGRLATCFLLLLTAASIPLVLPQPLAAEEAEPTAQEDRASEESKSEGVKEQSFLAFVFWAQPFLFFIILLMSIFLGYCIINGFLLLQIEKVIPVPVATRLEQHVKDKQYKEAYEAIKTDGSLFSKALRSGIEQLSQGWEQAMDTMLGTIEDWKISIEHRITPIAVFGQLGPMIGLFGTVYGMIRAFMTLSAGGQPKPSVLAGEIAIALVATMEGLVLALPAIWFYAVLKNKVQRLVFDVENLSETYLRKFAAVTKKT
jgi:biopolymer transport protein ExbB